MRVFTSTLSSSYVTTAVLASNETTTVATPGTAARLRPTAEVQKSQTIFCTARVMVLSAANDDDEISSASIAADSSRDIGTLHWGSDHSVVNSRTNRIWLTGVLLNLICLPFSAACLRRRYRQISRPLWLSM